MSGSAVRDPWADWLLHGRHRGAPQRPADEDRAYQPLRDRVLDGARLQEGQRVLDVGTGTGLLAREARRRVGAAGLVVGLDVSPGALAACRRRAGPGGSTARLRLVLADAAELPFPAAAFDAAVARSVLTYVDQRRAAGELFRVLVPGGRVSAFEPVNRVGYARYAWRWGLDLAPVQPAHDRIVARMREGSPFWDAALGFDERDLVGAFVGAGFAAVDLVYEHHYRADRRMDPAAARAQLGFRPFPGALSYEEAARAILGAAAEEHLARLCGLLCAQPLTEAGAVAYVTARR